MRHIGKFIWLVLLTGVFTDSAGAQNAGDEVAVLFNKALPESEEVARHYAVKRSIPVSQLLGLNLPDSEVISRADFENKLQHPLWEWLVQQKLFELPAPGSTEKFPVAAKIRYLTLCYGVPLKIARENDLVEDSAEKFPLELRRNEAAVDSELATLPLLPGRPHLVGLLGNRAFHTTNTSSLHPTNGILMVARLDGPTAAIAKGLVDKALEAERTGLFGRAYFDGRGLTNSAYELGDRWINAAAQMTRSFGFETTVDSASKTFPASTPMSHIALYFGWYDTQISGPFVSRSVEFIPGAIAYHLYSFSAQSIRAREAHWVGPLLDRGITATVGYTEEPYLQFTMDLPVFTLRLFQKFSFGEAAYAAQQALSWQTTVVGDPLYRPFLKESLEYYAKLIQEGGELGDWALLFQINRGIVSEPSAVSQFTTDLEKIGRTQTSSILQEKLGDLYKTRGKLNEAIDPYLAALKLPTTRQQRLRTTLSVAWILKTFQRSQEAYDLYKGLLEDYPEYSDRPSIYEKLAPVADKLGKKEEAAEYRKKARG